MKNIIADLYRQADEIDRDNFAETMNKTVSVVMDIEHTAMLQVLSTRFHTSLSPFCRNILEQATREALGALTKEDLVNLTARADEKIVEQMKKAGIEVPDTYKFWSRYLPRSTDQKGDAE